MSDVPTTLAEVIDAEILLMSDQDKLNIIAQSKDDLIQYHHSWGQYIRNHYRLWHDSLLAQHLKALGHEHPDDMSMVIIEAIWDKLKHWAAFI